MSKRIKKVGNIFPSNYETGDILDPEGISPSLKRGVRDAVNTQIPKIVVDSKKLKEEPTIIWIQSSQEKKGGIKSRKGVIPTLGARMGTGGGNIPMVMDSKKHDKTMEHSPIYDEEGKRTPEAHRIYGAEGITPALKHPILLDAFGLMTSTSTPAVSTERTSGQTNFRRVTSVQLTLTPSPTTAFSPLAFLARVSALLERGWVFRTLVERFSTRFVELQRLKDLRYYCLRTSGDSSATMKDLRFRSSLNRWRNWGIGVSGRYLTANTMGFHRTGSECSLSDILETEVDEKYFLSSQAVKHLMSIEGKGLGYSATRSIATITKDTTEKEQ